MLNLYINPLRPEWVGRSFLGETKFVLSNFLSNEDLSILYESWDLQLTFNVWKMDALFQCPLGPISIILNFPKNFLVKADIKQLYKKNWEVLMKFEGIQALSMPGWTKKTVVRLRDSFQSWLPTINTAHGCLWKHSCNLSTVLTDSSLSSTLLQVMWSELQNFVHKFSPPGSSLAELVCQFPTTKGYWIPILNPSATIHLHR